MTYPKGVFNPLNGFMIGNYSACASGGPAGGQAYEKFDKQALKNDSLVARELKANVIYPEERGAMRIRKLLSRWLTVPPEASF